MQNSKFTEMHKDFKPILYNIWNTQEAVTKIITNGKNSKITEITKDYQQA